MSERASTIAALVLLSFAGGAAWHFESRAPLVAEPAVLSTVPYEMSGYRGVDTPVDEAVEAMLHADYNVQRAYRHPLGSLVWLYLGYYGTQRGGTPEHTPRTCYAAQDWSIVEEQSVVIDAASGARAVEYLVESRGQQQLVHFWYRSYRRSGMSSTLALQLDHIVGNLVDGRGDGALIRLSIPLNGIDPDAARAQLIAFANNLERALDSRWPIEKARSGGTP